MGSNRGVAGKHTSGGSLVRLVAGCLTKLKPTHSLRSGFGCVGVGFRERFGSSGACLGNARTRKGGKSVCRALGELGECLGLSWTKLGELGEEPWESQSFRAFCLLSYAVRDYLFPPPDFGEHSSNARNRRATFPTMSSASTVSI